MKAAVYEKYGAPDVVAIREVPAPEIGENQCWSRSMRRR